MNNFKAKKLAIITRMLSSGNEVLFLVIVRVILSKSITIQNVINEELELRPITISRNHFQIL
ncbi:MAG: hypothetical protein JWQ79_1911 [Mucilaginibacter sp.]|nr:hypothetical protein [Mucilaginibacter sp.]